jgi:hypothetical protein
MFFSTGIARAGARHTDPHRDHHPCNQATAPSFDFSMLMTMTIRLVMMAEDQGFIVHDHGSSLFAEGVCHHHQNQETVCLTLRRERQ